MVPAFRLIGTPRAFTHRVQIQSAQDALELLKIFATEETHLQPVRARMRANRHLARRGRRFACQNVEGRNHFTELILRLSRCRNNKRGRVAPNESAEYVTLTAAKIYWPPERVMDHREQLGKLLRSKSLVRGVFHVIFRQEEQLLPRLPGDHALDPEGAFHTGYAVLEMLDAMSVKADAIGGLSMGADPIVSAAILVSYIEKRPIRGFLVRKERKAHGRQKRIEGLDGPVERVVIVDDACTTGASTQDAIDAAEEAGYKVVAVISLVDREEGGSEMLRAKYNYRAIFTARELLAERQLSTASTHAV